MNVLIAINSFKESLHSHEIAEIIELELCKISSKFHCIQKPVTDGGAGFVQIITGSLHGALFRKKVAGPLGDSVYAMYGLCEHGKTAVIELAQAAGLYRIPVRKRNPLRTNTRGVGQLIRAAIQKGARHILLGIGDSATIDCGIGALSVLGVRFLDRDGAEIPLNCSGILRLHRVDLSGVMKRLQSAKITIAADVDNTLTGYNGTVMYAAQKGATPRMIPVINRALRRFRRIMYAETGIDLDHIPGSGAAGGIGGAFHALVGAGLVNGFSFVRETLHLDRYLKHADCVITGEGMIDKKSRHGKAAVQVMKMAHDCKKPVILVVADAGDDDYVYADYGVIKMYALTDKHTKKYAQQNARRLLHTLARSIGEYLAVMEQY